MDRSDEPESRIGLAMSLLLGIVLAVSLVAGGRQMAAGTPSLNAPAQTLTR